MIIKKHAGIRYKERVGAYGSEDWGKDYTNQRVIEHLNVCRPVTDVEMACIRKSKKSYYSEPDRGGAKHLIDPATFLIFVVVFDDEEGDDVVITCYDAPYLQFLGAPNDDERKRILEIFKKAGEERSSTRWAVALKMLDQDGFTVFLDDIPRSLFSYRMTSGLLVDQKAVGSDKDPKLLKEGSLRAISWCREKHWTFSDFGIASGFGFDEKFRRDISAND